jgi:hypothetical protein
MCAALTIEWHDANIDTYNNTMQNITITECGAHVFAGYNFINCNVNNINTTYNGIGTVYQASRILYLTNNVLHSNFSRITGTTNGTAIEIGSECSNITLSELNVDSIAGNAIKIGSTSTKIKASECTFKTDGSIAATNITGSFVSLLNSTIEHTASSSVTIFSVPSSANNLTLSNCVIKSIDSRAFYSEADYLKINNCYIDTGTAATAIQIYGNRSVVTDNIIRGSYPNRVYTAGGVGHICTNNTLDNDAHIAFATIPGQESIVMNNYQDTLHSRNTMKLGYYSLWIDSAGDLRIFAGNRTSDTDGTIVGTQS